jgi:transposase
VEGINNKIKTLKRQAYGFRDMTYFKLRLYHLRRVSETMAQSADQLRYMV